MACGGSREHRRLWTVAVGVDLEKAAAMDSCGAEDLEKAAAMDGRGAANLEKAVRSGGVDEICGGRFGEGGEI